MFLYELRQKHQNTSFYVAVGTSIMQKINIKLREFTFIRPKKPSQQILKYSTIIK